MKYLHELYSGTTGYEHKDDCYKYRKLANIYMSDTAMLMIKWCRLLRIDKERHTCKHFFYLCTHARYFWNKFQSWWSLHIDAMSQLKLDLGTILYGHLSNFKYSLFLYHLILIAKQHMYNSFINEQKYTFPSSFLNHATNKYQIEKRIALSSNTKQLSNVFEKKWAPFTNFLSKTA